MVKEADIVMGTSSPGRRNSIYKGPEVGVCLVCLRKIPNECSKAIERVIEIRCMCARMRKREYTNHEGL